MMKKAGLVVLVGLTVVAAGAAVLVGCASNGPTGYCLTNTDCGGRNVDYSELAIGEKYCSDNRCFTKVFGG